MDAIAPGGGVLLKGARPALAFGAVAAGVGCAAAAWVGCATHGPGGAIGASSGAGAAFVAGLDAGLLPDGGPAAIPAGFRQSLTKVNATRFVSRGHAGGRWDVDVYADDAGVDALRTERGTVAPGAVFIEEHFERGDGGAGPIFLMEKRSPGFDPAHGDWRYVAVGSRGELVREGAVESCAACHGDAPHDHVFKASE